MPGADQLACMPNYIARSTVGFGKTAIRCPCSMSLADQADRPAGARPVRHLAGEHLYRLGRGPAALACAGLRCSARRRAACQVARRRAASAATHVGASLPSHGY